MRRFSAILVAAAALGIIGCQPNAPFREDVGACPTLVEDNGAACGAYSLEEHWVPGFSDKFLLGFVELDDQGRPYLPTQIKTLFDRLQTEARYRDLALLIFIHGWKHNDAYSDTNVAHFRNLLRQMAEMELQRPPGYWPTRKVVGIYIGWRGLSFDGGEIGQDLTFWTRMAAAHRVAEGSVREVLARAKSLRDAVDATSWPGLSGPRNTRLVTIGHSFGGLIVYTALSQYFVDRVVQSATAPFADSLAPRRANGRTDNREIAGYGDLVVVVNPAIEAMRYEPIRELVEDGRDAQRFAPNQNPVFVEVTSDADWATGIAFPIGRTLNTTFESFTGEGERREAQAALGQYPPFWTHNLDGPTPEADPSLQLPPIDVDRECAQFEEFEKKARSDGYLAPGWRRQYRTGAVLTHRAQSAFDPNLPFWIVRTDKSMIRDHNDIEEPVFVDFVRQVYDDLVRLKEQEPCGAHGRRPGKIALNSRW